MVTLVWLPFSILWTTLLVQGVARLAPVVAAASALIPAQGPGVAWLTLMVLPLMGVALLGEEAWLPWRRDDGGAAGRPTLPAACGREALTTPDAAPIAVDVAAAACEPCLPCELCPVAWGGRDDVVVPAPTRVRLDLAARARGARHVRRASVTRRVACACGQPRAPRRPRAQTERNGSRSRRGAPMSTTRTTPV